MGERMTLFISDLLWEERVRHVNIIGESEIQSVDNWQMSQDPLEVQIYLCCTDAYILWAYIDYILLCHSVLCIV